MLEHNFPRNLKQPLNLQKMTACILPVISVQNGEEVCGPKESRLFNGS